MLIYQLEIARLKAGLAQAQSKAQSSTTELAAKLQDKDNQSNQIDQLKAIGRTYKKKSRDLENQLEVLHPSTLLRLCIHFV